MKILKNIIILLVNLFFIIEIQADEVDTIKINIPRFRIGIEFASNLFIQEINKPDRIRENRSYYYESNYDRNFYCGFVAQPDHYFCSSFGIKPEFAFGKSFALTTGIRYIFNKIKLSSDKDYFLWKVNEDGNKTNYVKIQNIQQQNYYIGIPLEFILYTNRKDLPVRHYFLGGVAFNILVASKNTVNFQNKNMQKYTTDVLNNIAKPNIIHGNIYIGCGFKCGKSKYPFGNVEFFIPISYSQIQENSLLKGGCSAGFGFQTSLKIPILKKYKLNYIVIDD